MPFHRQQPATVSKLGAVYEHEGMSLCVCAELPLDNSTVTRCFNACPSSSCAALLPRPLKCVKLVRLGIIGGMSTFYLFDSH